MRVPFLVWLAGFATVCLVNQRAYAPPVHIIAHTPGIVGGEFSSDRKHVICDYDQLIENVCNRRWAAMIDATTGDELHQHVGCAVAFLPDGKRYVTADCDLQNHSTLTIREVWTGKVVRTFA